MNCKISVIIPCYNQAHFLKAAVESVMAQRFQNWECIIVNDGATDNTNEVATELCKLDGRIKLISQPNKGLSAARNAGIANATGEYIQLLDADDLLDAGKFSESLQEGNDADIIFSNFMMMYPEGNITHPPFKLTRQHFRLEEVLLKWDIEFVFPPHSGLFKRELFQNTSFDETIKAREDWLMWVTILAKNPAVSFVDLPLAIYRVSPQSMSKNKDLMDYSLLRVYDKAFELVPQAMQQSFFRMMLHRMEQLLTEHKTLLARTRNSNSFRLGNFFVRPLSKFFPRGTKKTTGT